MKIIKDFLKINCPLDKLEKTFNNFVKELERKGIIDDELSDGFEFIGGPKGFRNYIEANAARLVIELGGELDLQGKQNSKTLEAVTLSKSPKQNEFLFERFESIENKDYGKPIAQPALEAVVQKIMWISEKYPKKKDEVLDKYKSQFGITSEKIGPADIRTAEQGQFLTLLINEIDSTL